MKSNAEAGVAGGDWTVAWLWGKRSEGMDAERFWAPVAIIQSTMGRQQMVLMREAASLHFKFKSLTLLLF